MKKTSLQGKIEKKSKDQLFITYKKYANGNDLKNHQIKAAFRKKNIFFNQNYKKANENK